MVTVKRSGPLRRTTTLKARTQLKRGSGLRKESDKRAAENKARTRAMTLVRQRSGGRCEARALIALVDPVAASNCTGRATDGHEKQKRSRGGSIADPRNIVHVCRRCHDWTEDQPALATEVGLLISQWD